MSTIAEEIPKDSSKTESDCPDCNKAVVSPDIQAATIDIVDFRNKLRLSIQRNSKNLPHSDQNELTDQEIAFLNSHVGQNTKKASPLNLDKVPTQNAEMIKNIKGGVKLDDGKTSIGFKGGGAKGVEIRHKFK